MRSLSNIILFLFILVGFTACNEEGLSPNQEDVIYVRHKGADMPAFVYGNASSKVFIIVIHGGPGGNGLEYRLGSYAEELEQAYAMVYWDQRGQGASQGNYDNELITVSQMAEDLYILVRVMKEKYGEDISIFLFGHSWGGMLGTKFMVNATYRQEVDGWIESNGAHDIPLLNREAIKMFLTIGGDEIQAGRNVEQWEPIVEFAEGVDTTGTLIDESGQINQFGFEAESLIEEIQVEDSDVRQLVRYLFNDPSNLLVSFVTGSYTANQLFEEVESLSLTDQLNQIDVPSLILVGKYDFVVPPALGYSAYERIGTAEKELVEFEFSGHSPMGNEPDLYVQAITSFIDRYK